MVSLKFKAQQMSVENPLHSTNLHRQQSKLTLANDPNESIDPSSLSLPRSCADQRGSIIKNGPRPLQNDHWVSCGWPAHLHWPVRISNLRSSHKNHLVPFQSKDASGFSCDTHGTSHWPVPFCGAALPPLRPQHLDSLLQATRSASDARIVHLWSTNPIKNGKLILIYGFCSLHAETRYVTKNWIFKTSNRICL